MNTLKTHLEDLKDTYRQASIRLIGTAALGGMLLVGCGEDTPTQPTEAFTPTATPSATLTPTFEQPTAEATFTPSGDPCLIFGLEDKDQNDPVCTIDPPKQPHLPVDQEHKSP